MTKAERSVKEAKKEVEKEAGVKKSNGSNFGMLLIFVGLVWLAIDQGWIPKEWPIWPILIISSGLWLLISRRKH